MCLFDDYIITPMYYLVPSLTPVYYIITIHELIVGSTYAILYTEW